MANEKLKVNQIHVTWAILIAIFAIALLIVFPFLTAIISSYVLAFFLLPLFRVFNKRLGKTFSAILCVLILILLILVPTFFIVNQTIHEISSLAKNINQTNITLPGSFAGIDTKSIQADAVSAISSWIGRVIGSIPKFLITVLVIFFGVFYFLYDWDKINTFIYKKSPFQNKKKLFEDIEKTTRRITFGLLLVGTYEFTIALLGFTLSGVNFSLIFALIIGIMGFTLVLDASIIWIPLAIFYFLMHDSGTAIGVLITGVILSTDTFIRPKVVGSVTDISPFIMLLGVLGGVPIFGILGIVIGPVVLFFAIRLLKESFEVHDGKIVTRVRIVKSES